MNYSALGTLILRNNPFGGNTNLGGFSQWFENYNNKWGGLKYGLLNTGISAGADLAGNIINSNGMSTTTGNIMSGIGNIVGNIPGPIGWAGKGLALAGLAVNALWGHKFNDANVAAAESANRERNNWQFGDYSNTDALLAGSMANVLLGNVNKSFVGKEGPFSNAVTDKMNLINNDRMLANLRANNSELNAYNNYLTGMVRNAIAGDNMGSVNAAAAGGPLSMISGPMTPFGNRYFADGGYTHGGLFTNGFIEVNNGGSHELNPNQGVLYGVDPQGTPNMVEEGETILDDYVFSKRIKFPKKYKDEFSLGGKIWKKSFADVSKMIAKESEERPNDPISQRSLKAMGGKLADIQEEVKAKQALDKMDPREVMAMLLQLAMLQQSGELPLMQEEQMMADPYQQQMMLELGVEEQPIMAAKQVLANPDNYSSAMVKKANFARNAAKWHACGGKLHTYGGNLFPVGGYIARSDSGSQYANNAANQMLLHMPIKNTVDIAKQENARRNEAARRKVNARGVEETVTEKKERYRKNKSNLSKARKYQKIADNLQKTLPKKYNTNQGFIYDADAIDKARMLKDDLINSARSIGQTLGKDLDVYTLQDAINSMYNTANLANLSGYAAGIGIEDPIGSLVGLAGSYLGSEIGGRVSDSPYAPLIGALIGGGLAGGESRIGRPAKVFVTEEEAARNAARDAYLMKVGLPVPSKDFYAGFPLEMFTTPGWHTDPTTLFPTVRSGMTTLGTMYGLDKALEGFGVEKNNNANGGKLNVFLPGGQTNIPNYNSQYSLPNLLEYVLNMINNINMLEIKKRGKRTKTAAENTSTPKEETTTTNAPLDVTQYGFKKGIKGLAALETIYNKTNFADPKSIATLLYHYVDNGIIDYKDAAKLFYNISHNTFPGLKEGENSAKYLKNLLGLRGEGYDEPVYKTDKNGNVIKGEDGNPVEDKAKSKHYSWVGPEYFKAMANLPNTFELSRGFKGNKDLKGLKYSFDENSNVDDFLDYLTAYGSTDPQVQAKYLNEKRAETEKLYRDYYNENKDFDNLLKDIEYYNNSLSNEGGQSDLIIKNAQASYEDRVAEALASKNTAEKEAIMEDLDDFLDYLGYGDDPVFQALLYESDGNPIDVESISAVDPNSEDFKKLTPLLQKIARGKWIKENFENNKEWKTYREQFEKEEADELAKKQREEELLKSLEYNALPTWMRYAPLAFSSIATLTDALGLTNKADLTPYRLLIAQSDRMSKVPSVRYHPTFLPMQYQPMNLNYDLALASNMFGAASRNMNNIAGANIGAATAGNLTALNLAGANYGKLRTAIADADLKNRTGVAEFNNKGAYQDATGSLQAQQINTNNIQNALKFGYQALADALRYYQSEQQAANAAKQVNLTHAVNSWANVGRENMYMNMINSNRALDYGTNLNGTSFYKALYQIMG